MTTATAAQRAAGEPRGALGDLLAHVGDVEVADVADPFEQRHRRLGLVGMDVDLERGLVADDQYRVAEGLEVGDVGAAVEAGAGDDEVRAVAVAAVLVVRARRDGGRVMLELRHRGVVVAEAGHDPGEDHDQPVGACVDDTLLAQHLELLGGARDRGLSVLDHVLEQSRDHRVLLPGVVPLGSLASSMWASFWATEWAISRKTVSIVPSAGSRTES